MAIVPALTYNLTNGTTADANQVMSNFNTIRNGVNSNAAENGVNASITQLTGLSTPLTVPQGGTGVGTATSGAPIVGAGTNAFTTGLTVVSNSLGSDVALNNTANYFTGPTCAQGTSGKWYASGTVTLKDTNANSGVFNVKLWDGTTVIDSARVRGEPNSGLATVSLSGVLNTPAGNIRMSVQDETNSTNAAIVFNDSGNSKDSTLTVFQIA